MKSTSITISQPRVNIVIVISVIIYSLVLIMITLNPSYSFGTVNRENINTLSSISIDPVVLINTTSLSNCLQSSDSFKNNLSNSLIKKDNYLIDYQESYSDNPTNIYCKIYDVSDNNSCFKYFTNQSILPCNSHNSDETILDIDNFNDEGLLIVDTRFNNSYDFELKDPLNSEHLIGVNLDLDKHTQGNISDLNSPRIEIIRKDSNGVPNMSLAKNQEIIWQGSIKDYFKKPTDNYQNETYIALQFNTGRHGSNIPAEERGFGVLFDVSSSTNPYLFEYRDDGVYTKYDYDLLKRFAGEDFIFHNLDENNNPIFINNLTNRDEVKLKVITSLSANGNSTRIIETFLDTGSGVENPYWTLNDLSKLKVHDRIIDENEFIETINQGSGYTIARTDNIDTRLLAFHSFAF